MNIEQIREIEKTYAVNNEYKFLFDNEEKIISSTIKSHKSYKDPRQDRELSGGLISLSRDPQVYYRYFISDYRDVFFKQLDFDQVRLTQIDKEDCKGRIWKSIELNGLIYPPFLYQKTSCDVDVTYGIGTGHNRCWTIGVYKGQKIPSYIRTHQYKVEIDHNKKTLTVSVLYTALYEVKAKIGANKPNTSRPYTMNDACLHLEECYKADRTFDGICPNGMKPDRQQFDEVMDLMYGADGYFNTKGPRTKIWKQFTSGKSHSKFIDITSQSEVDSYLSRHGYHIGREGSSKRKGTGHHFCSKNKAIVLITDSNGRHLNEKISLLMEKEKMDPDWKIPEEHSIHVFGRIYKPSSDLTELNRERELFESKCRNMNDFLSLCNSKLRISNVICPKQLVNSSDKDRLKVFEPNKGLKLQKIV